MRRWAAVAGAVVLLAGCGDSGNSATSSASQTQDSYGDPYVTDAQVRQIHVGMSATDAFAQLGGRPGSGYNGIQAGPTKSYDFPIRGTGNPDDVTDDSTIWWEVCVLHGRVVSKHRGRMGDLPDCR